METAMQTLWEFIDANYHEDSFNLNDARDMSMSLEKQQIERAYSSGAADVVLRQFKDSDTYYKTVYNQNK